MSFLRTLLICTIFAVLTIACENETQNDATTDTDTATKPAAVSVPRFDRDSAMVYVQKQTEFGSRIPNSEAHRQTKEWLSAKLADFGATVIEQDFTADLYTGESYEATNIIGQYNPEHSKRVILAAHWDSRFTADHDPNEENHDEPVMGADDGASGVGVLLEIARQLQANPIDLGIDIILFDAEDNGDGSEDGDYRTWCLGSQHWARNFHVSGYEAKFGILLDMVGAKNARFTKDGISMAYAPNIMNKVWKLAQSMGYGAYFVDVPTRELVDDHLFVNQIAKIPMIDIINRPADTETLFVAHWHTTEDTFDKIDPRTLRAVGQVVLATIYRESGGTF